MSTSWIGQLLKPILIHELTDTDIIIPVPIIGVLLVLVGLGAGPLLRRNGSLARRGKVKKIWAKSELQQKKK